MLGVRRMALLVHGRIGGGDRCGAAGACVSGWGSRMKSFGSIGLLRRRYCGVREAALAPLPLPRKKDMPLINLSEGTKSERGPLVCTARFRGVVIEGTIGPSRLPPIVGWIKQLKNAAARGGQRAISQYYWHYY